MTGPASQDLLLLKAREAAKADRLSLGPATILVASESLAREFQCTPEQVRVFLDGLGVPRICLPGLDRDYFSLAGLEMALFIRLLPYPVSDKLNFSTSEDQINLMVSWIRDLGTMYNTAAGAKVRERLGVLGDQLLRRKGPRKPSKKASHVGT